MIERQTYGQPSPRCLWEYLQRPSDGISRATVVVKGPVTSKGLKGVAGSYARHFPGRRNCHGGSLSPFYLRRPPKDGSNSFATPTRVAS